MATTADWYLGLARRVAGGRSSLYEEWARGIAADTAVLKLIEDLTWPQRQPNLMFAAARFLGAPVAGYAQFREWLTAHWPDVVTVLKSRSIQTNEPGRMAALLPVLARIPGPLALIEVGASAGLCLYPDMASYHYDNRPPLHPPTGPSRLTLHCSTNGAVPIPDKLPPVASRVGIDLFPRDVTSDEDVRWLESLIWPGQSEQLRLLHAALDVARNSPPQLVCGDLNAVIDGVVHNAPSGATPVVFHSAVMPYLEPPERVEFEQHMRALPCRWVSNEVPSVLPPSIKCQLPEAPDRGDDQVRLVLSLDGSPLAYTSPHGETLEWLAPADVVA